MFRVPDINARCSRPAEGTLMRLAPLHHQLPHKIGPIITPRPPSPAPKHGWTI
ncbi:hypothetical protein T261_8402 [Streptomyces lydicus]|nr:hypothetical protein T261_8402 [Streptomyces lydicus]